MRGVVKAARSTVFLLFFITVTIAKLFGAHSCKSPSTPIKHLVIIFQENRSFDHYFGSYPFALNPPSDPPFFPRKGTPAINGLSLALCSINQNLAQPFRLTRDQAAADTNAPIHQYTPLQQACDGGLMDKFVQFTGANCNPPSIVMGYFDGNSVTAMWNYAQYFAMSDNFHSTHIGASTVGALNLISGQVHGVIPLSLPNIIVQGTMINDIDPFYDDCSGPFTAQLTGINIGNLLNQKGITWGWFQGGFSDCSSKHPNPSGILVADYVPHHNPFQYYQSTSNPEHLPPSSLEMVGKTDRANHLYDISDFWSAAEEGNVPAVSFFKAPAYQNGHAGNSSPLLEQEFLVSTINRLQRLPQWKNMAIIIAYDDSGGWYDHEVPTIVNQSQISNDAFSAPGSIGNNPPLGGYQGRPSYGFRLPFILISPWAKENYVDSSLIDQTSILSFIEDNWNLGRIGDFSFDAYAESILPMFNFHKKKYRVLILDPGTGEIVFKQR